MVSRPAPEGPFRVRIVAGTGLAPAGWPEEAGVGPLAATVFQTRPFLETWHATIGAARGALPVFVMVHQGGRPVLSVALSIERRGPFRTLCFPDAGVCDANGPLLDVAFRPAPGWFPGIWRDVLEAIPDVDVIDLQKLAQSVGAVDNPFLELATSPHPSTGNLIDIAATSIDAFGQHPDRRKMFGRLRRKRSRLEEAGQVDFAVAHASAAAIRIWDRLVVFKRAQFLATRGFDEFQRDGIGRFYAALLGEASIGRPAVTAALTVDGAIVAAGLLLLDAGRVHMVVTGCSHDRRYARFSPGLLLLVDVLRWSMERGASEFDFGEGNLPYKDGWISRRVPLRDHRRAVTVLGRAYAPARWMGRILRSLRLRRAGWLRSGRCRSRLDIEF